MKKQLMQLSLILFSVSCFAQQDGINLNIFSWQKYQHRDFALENNWDYKNPKTVFNTDLKKSVLEGEIVLISSFPDIKVNYAYKNDYLSFTTQQNMKKNLFGKSDDFYDKNRRNIYSSVWAFASLNYLYCDLVGLMDKNVHAQYEAGVVDGTKITPQFLTMAAGFMQISIANVFLPQIIKNDRALRWVQIASGTIMTLVQAGTLFVGKPTPYYALFSAFEIGATTYITIDAIKWKRNSKKRILQKSN